jgi:hypothetical protein
VFGGELAANRFEVLTRIKPFRNGADIFAESLAIAQID